MENTTQVVELSMHDLVCLMAAILYGAEQHLTLEDAVQDAERIVAYVEGSRR